MKQKPSRIPILTGEMFESIEDLLMIRFIDCSCDGNFRALIKSGDVPLALLEERWAKIQDEYANAANDGDSRHTVIMLKEINILEFRIGQGMLIVEALRISHNDTMVRQLREMGFVGEKLNPLDKAQYHHDLESIVGKIKRMTTEVSARKSEQESMASGNTVVMDRKYYAKSLFVLSKHCKYRLDKFKITVSDYIAALNDYRDTIDQLNANAAMPEM